MEVQEHTEEIQNETQPYQGRKHRGAETSNGGSGGGIVLGPRDSLVGKLTTEGDVRIQGTVEGELTAAGDVWIEEKSTVKANVEGRNVNVRGPLEVKSYKADAEIDARSLGDTARVENYKGSTVLRVPENTGLNIEFSGGRRASFHSDFPVNTGARAGYGESFSGTVNSGGTRLYLRTERGSVTLEKYLSAQ